MGKSKPKGERRNEKGKKKKKNETKQPKKREKEWKKSFWARNGGGASRNVAKGGKRIEKERKEKIDKMKKKTKKESNLESRENRPKKPFHWRKTIVFAAITTPFFFRTIIKIS